MWHPQSRYTRPGPSKSSAPQILFLIFLLIEGLASLTISTLATYGLTTFATNPPVRLPGIGDLLKISQGR